MGVGAGLASGSTVRPVPAPSRRAWTPPGPQTSPVARLHRQSAPQARAYYRRVPRPPQRPRACFQRCHVSGRRAGGGTAAASGAQAAAPSLAAATTHTLGRAAAAVELRSLERLGSEVGEQAQETRARTCELVPTRRVHLSRARQWLRRQRIAGTCRHAYAGPRADGQVCSDRIQSRPHCGYHKGNPVASRCSGTQRGTFDR